MIGIYDSGSGGLTALSALRRTLPDTDILYRGDLKRAPYGTKTREELLPILRENLNDFRAYGCQSILVACMTASSLLPYLSEQERCGAVPITDFVGACAVRATRTGRVGVVSTSVTMREGRLKSYLLSHGLSLSESAADALVPLAERGEISKNSPRVRRAIADAVEIHKSRGVDTLILGCTHFPYFTEAFREAMGEEVSLISSGEAGALGFLKQIPKDVLKGKGHIQFI